jgi:4-hydroxy-4-methyl-2-oxoglutarate aldolase
VSIQVQRDYESRDLPPSNTEAVREALGDASSSLVSDALVKLGVVPHVLRGLNPLDNVSAPRLLGRAVTMGFAPVTSERPFIEAPYMANHVIRRAESGDVIVMATAHAPFAFWGDQMVRMAQTRGLSGAVTDGCARDVAEIRELGFPIFCHGFSPETYLDYHEAVTYNEVVEISGVRISPGDILLGDQDGIVVVPQERLDDVAWALIQLREFEQWLRSAVASGRHPDELYPESHRRLQAIGKRRR